MTAARDRDNEPESIAALHALDVLDTAAEPAFDALVRAASIVCGVPISLISLIDTDRQWFKANIGLPGLTQTPREHSFCAHAVLEDELFVVNDAQRDPRFAQNPLVVDAPAIRFYAGAPLRLSDGQLVGTLCVIDRQPRELSDEQRDVLRSLGAAAAHALEGRRALLAIKDAAMETARSEVTLSLEQRRLSNVIDGANVGTWDLNLRTGMVKVSARWAEITDHSLESLQYLTYDNWFEQFHPEDIPRARLMFEQHLAGVTARYDCELRARRSDGTFVWVVDRGRVMTRGSDGAVDWVVGARIDIDEPKEREEAARRNARFLNQIGKLAGVGGWQVDVAAQRIYWSEETCRLHGVDVGYEPTMRSLVEFYTREARPILQNAIDQAFETGESWDLELPLARADGKERWVRAIGSAEFGDGGVVRLVGALQDVTTRVLEHRALKDANERVALATDSGGIGIWEYGVGDRSLVWDAWMYRLYGMPLGSEPMTLRGWRKLVPGDGLDRVERAIEEAIRDGQSVDVEFEITWPDGTLRHLRSAARLVRDAEGNPHRFIGATWDVTESRRLAAELRRKSLVAAVLAGVAVSANEARNLLDALASCVDLVCSHTGWDVGHVYLPSTEDPDLFVSSSVWNTMLSERFAAFRKESAESTFVAGTGLVGAVLRNHRAVLIDDLSSAQFSRRTSAMSCGIRWGLAAPVLVGDEIVAVLEFFSTDSQPFDRALIELVSYAGVQLGRVVDRDRAHASLERQTERLREQSIIDELTSLYNRRGFLELAEERRKGAQRTGQRVFLLFADLDGMKTINDTLGHEAGDRALVEAAGVLRRTLRSADIVARLGGDEFVALTCETGAFDTPALLARLDAELVSVNSGSDRAYKLACSFGVTGPAEPGEGIAGLLKRADEEMYKQKVARKKARPTA